MIPIFTKQFIATAGYKFKLRLSLQTSKEVRYRFFSYFYRREFSSITGLVMGDNQLTDSGATLVAVCQMNSTNDVDRNMGICKDLINKAKSRGAKFVFLPECFDYVGENSEQSLSMAEPLESPRMQILCELAKELGVWLSLGGYHEKGPPDDKRLRNSHVIVNDSGSIVAVYRKIHLFDIDVKDGPRLKESDTCIPGNQIVPPVSTPVGNVGLAICYDVRFPELSLILAQQGADILTFPSAFTQITGSAHWEVLLRCRAVENQCYVIAAAQTGQHNAKRRSYGHAMVVDPWGCVIAQCHEGNDVCVAEIDLGYLNKIRQQMPLMNHRRTDIYGSLNSGPKL
ncbi:deaminated glutathione amidase-like [Pocillopora damicornis]|nr:deaminated glutathione amidase-like [Pocillopora damicornis]